MPGQQENKETARLTGLHPQTRGAQPLCRASLQSLSYGYQQQFDWLELQVQDTRKLVGQQKVENISSKARKKFLTVTS